MRLSSEVRLSTSARSRARSRRATSANFSCWIPRPGDYELDSDALTAVHRARAKRPDGAFYVLRVGHSVAYRLGLKALAAQHGDRSPHVNGHPMIEEIHAVREALAKESGYDPEKIAEAARKRQAENGRKVVTLPPRPTPTVKKKAS
jgi:hypothetical protein